MIEHLLAYRKADEHYSDKYQWPKQCLKSDSNTSSIIIVKEVSLLGCAKMFTLMQQNIIVRRLMSWCVDITACWLIGLLGGWLVGWGLIIYGLKLFYPCLAGLAVGKYL
jgi:hypothetical protein